MPYGIEPATFWVVAQCFNCFTASPNKLEVAAEITVEIILENIYTKHWNINKLCILVTEYIHW